MGSYYKQQLNDFVAGLDVKAKIVLDIGGAQNPIKGRTAGWEVEDYKVVDLEVPHVEKQKPDIVWDMNNEVWVQTRADHALEVVVNYENKVDLIFMLGVMDYVINPNIAMRNIYHLLKDGGTAWVEFPFAYAHHEPVRDEGCRYSEGCINRLADQAGLKITETIRKMERSGLLRRWYSEEGQRMSPNYKWHGVTGFIVKLEK